MPTLKSTTVCSVLVGVCNWGGAVLLKAPSHLYQDMTSLTT